MKIRYRHPGHGRTWRVLSLLQDDRSGKEGRLADFISEIPVGEDCSVEIIL